MSAERRRLVKLDAQGQELLRFATPFDVMDLVESEDDEGALLAVVGLDTGVLYLRPDGSAAHSGDAEAPAEAAERLGRDLAAELLEAAGGRDFLA